MGMNRKGPVWISSLLVSAVLIAVPATAAADCPGADTQAIVAEISLKQFDSSVQCLLNEIRASQGLVELQSNSQLDQAALAHSTEMGEDHYFAHESPDGSAFELRLMGYIEGAPGDWLVGENIAWGSYILSTPRSLMTAWMNSPPHRKNILEPRFRELGVGTEWGSPLDPNLFSSAIVTTDFGFREEVPASTGHKKSQCRKKTSRKKRKACRVRQLRR
jgi:uncharacterized protein YkwD